MGCLLIHRADHLLWSKPLFRAGYIETAEVDELSFPVKLDTGADMTSMSATNLRYFEEKGVEMVNFDYTNAQGAKKTFTREVVDVFRVKAREGESGDSGTRPVVEMLIKLGPLERLVQVNLRDRTRFEYSMILGKNFPSIWPNSE